MSWESGAAEAANVRTWTSAQEGTARNVFAVETERGFVVIDAPLRVSDGVAARDWLRSLGKPVLGCWSPTPTQITPSP